VRTRTGAAGPDPLDDFAAARRRRMLSSVGRVGRPAARRRNRLVTVDHVLAETAQVGRRRLGVRPIPVADIVGTVDRIDDAFDGAFRPGLAVSRDRWVRIAESSRRGTTLPPIETYSIEGRHYVRDGHHRVSVARALGQEFIDADVTVISTDRGPDHDGRGPAGAPAGDRPQRSWRSPRGDRSHTRRHRARIETARRRVTQRLGSPRSRPR
jgi:hypothetical protein